MCVCVYRVCLCVCICIYNYTVCAHTQQVQHLQHALAEQLQTVVVLRAQLSDVQGENELLQLACETEKVIIQCILYIYIYIYVHTYICDVQGYYIYIYIYIYIHIYVTCRERPTLYSSHA